MVRFLRKARLSVFCHTFCESRRRRRTSCTTTKMKRRTCQILNLGSLLSHLFISLSNSFLLFSESTGISRFYYLSRACRPRKRDHATTDEVIDIGARAGPGDAGKWLGNSIHRRVSSSIANVHLNGRHARQPNATKAKGRRDIRPEGMRSPTHSPKGHETGRHCVSSFLCTLLA